MVERDSTRVVTEADILAAGVRIRDGIQRTPCPRSIPLSLATGCEVYCKLEYLQRTGSFKERGARNALLLLSPAERERGVIAASAGNHALGLAYHAQGLGVSATVVMPLTAPLTKITNCQQLGARVILHGNTIEEARVRAMELVQESSLTYVNGFDDPAIIAGQGTMGLEILEQVPDVDAVVVPVGGAGLLAGLAVALKSARPEIKIYGVEPERAASFWEAMQAGAPVMTSMQSTLADGLAVPKVGANGFALARGLVERTVRVREHFIALAILRLVELEKAVVEGAGAVPLGALLEGLLPELRGRKVVLPLCGGNIDTNILGRVLERGLAADGRLCRFSAVISDRPGGMSKFSALLAGEAASIREITHDRAFASEDITQVTVHCVIETRDHGHVRRVHDRLQTEGFQVFFPDLF